MELASVNWAAVITGTIAAFLFGWLIYSPKLFGKGWAEGSGMTLTEDSKPPSHALILQLIALFLLALIVGITETSEAIVAAIIAILATAVFVVANGAFSGKSRYALSVDGGYVVGAGALMIVAQGLL
ncbi:DUF1761 family protein [Litoreibacter sp.]|nr:DUF1761 family protein [Litoreibacter sp.]